VNTFHNGFKFTARDRDNDMWIEVRNCAADNWVGFNGGEWWYRGCSAILINYRNENHQSINLNNQYHKLCGNEDKTTDLCYPKNTVYD